MATMQPGLFGYDPTEINQANQQRFATAYGQAGSPYEKIGLSLGQLGTSAIKSLFDIQDPALVANKEATSIAAQYDLNTSAGLKQYTTALQQRAQETGNAQLAAIVPRAAAEYQKAALHEATIEQKTREKVVSTGEQVNQQLFAKFKQDAINMGAKPDQVDLVAAQLYDKYEKDSKVRVAQAGVAPAPGQVPLTTIKIAQDIVNEYTEKPKIKLQQIGVLSALGEGVKTNPTLLPKFQQESVRFAGDNQISAKEVAKSLGSLGFASDVVEGVNSFLEGKPTNVKIDKVLEGMRGLEKVYANQYNAGRDKAAVVLDQGKIAPETRAAILPPAYNIKPKVVAPSVGAVNNGYRFKGGDPSQQSNWEAVR